MLKPSSDPRESLAYYLDEFRNDWSLSRWEDFLTELPPKGTPLRASVLIEVTRIDMEYRYREGDGLFVEQYLALAPELGTFETVPMVLLETEIRLRQQFNQQLPLADFLERFPNRAEAIQTFLGELSTGRVGEVTPRKISVPKATKTFLDPSNLPEDFGHYRILKQLGAGGMGWVYLARDTRMDRLVALKVPRFTGADDKKTINRFYQEVRSAAALQHPNICSIYDVNQIDGVPFMTMRYIEGKTLASLIRPGKRWPEKEAIRVIRRLAAIVHAAHLKGVIHRDLKPTNAMLSEDKELIVMDFGLAFRSDGETDRLTRTGSPLGTPAYMCPEQAQGERDQIGPWSDVYSLGVMLYELLIGRRPFVGHSAVVMAHHIMTPPTPLREQRPSLSVQIEKVCLKAMAKDPEDRYRTAKEFADALAECQRMVSEQAETPVHSGALPTWVANQGPITDGPLPNLLSPTSQKLNALNIEYVPQEGPSGMLSRLEPEHYSTAPSFPPQAPPPGFEPSGNKWLVPVLVGLLIGLVAVLLVLILK